MSENTSNSAKFAVPEDGIGERIRARREERTLTQEALSILTKYPQIDPEGKGISRPAIVGYEKGSTLPGARELRILAEALDVTPSWLVLGKFDTRKTVNKQQALNEALSDFIIEAVENKKTAFLEPKSITGLNPGVRATLETEAKEAARVETQKRNKGRY